MQIKSTVRYHLITVRLAIIEKSTNNKYWRRCEEKATLLDCWWKHKLVQPLRRTVQIRSVAQLCPTLCDPMNRSTPGLPVHHQLPKFTETHVHRVIDAIQPSHPLLSPSPALNLSQHQGLFQ